ncbi:MAG: hypothetical protein FH758_12025 [Firmicutes bacterium]|nr:hypothetical protein [Bacillota bacterium]
MDWLRILAVSLPILYVIFFHIAPFLPLADQVPRWFMLPGSKLLIGSRIHITVFGIILGYTLLTSVKKKD